MHPTPHPVTAILAAAADDLDHAHLTRIVPWLSAHVAAIEHVVLPAARRALPPAQVAPHVDRTRRLEHALLAVHRVQAGDGRAARIDRADVVPRLRNALDGHLAALEQLLAALQVHMTEADWSALESAYDDALRHGPSRPHPHTPHGRLGERLAFPLARAVDHLLDVLDSRFVPPLPEQRNDRQDLSEARRSA
jgi:hypothetical protein